MQKKFLIASLTILLVSCAAPQNHVKKKEYTENIAIKGEGDIYYMPMGKDEDGCKYYNSFAPGKMTAAVLYYRKADGSFTQNKTDSVCKPEK